MDKKKLRNLFSALDKLYTLIPRVECKLKCSESCGAIADAIQPIELARVRKHLKMPDFVFPADSSCETCPPLTSQGICSVHEVRPLICRLYGVVRDRIMSCPHGCGGDKLTNAEAKELWFQVLELSDEFEIETTLNEPAEFNEGGFAGPLRIIRGASYGGKAMGDQSGSGGNPRR